MSALRQALDDYLALRDAMGCKVHEARRLLPQVVAFVERQGAASITSDRAVRGATQPRQVQPAAWARRLRLVRGFAQYRSAVDPHTEIPPPDLLPYRPPASDAVAL